MTTQDINIIMLFTCMFAFSLPASLAFAAPSRPLNRQADNPWDVIPPTPSLPGNVTGQFAKINGIDLWYAEFGTRNDASVPIVMLHGLLANSNWFGDVIERLMANHYVIAMDTRGQGRSTLDSTPLSNDLFASDTATLLVSLNITKATYVGWSDGANTALATLKNASIASMVDRAYLFGGTHNSTGHNVTFSQTTTYREFINRASAEYLAFQPNGNITALYDAVATKKGNVYSVDDLSTITIGDKVTVSDAEYEEAINLNEPDILQGAIRGSNLVILPDVSHFATVQNPDLFAASVEHFLAS